MIFTIMIVGMIELVLLILSVIPDLPPMPAAITSGGTTLADIIVNAVSFFRVILSTPLLAALVGTAVLFWAFETLYHPVMWAVKKLPFINIK